MTDVLLKRSVIMHLIESFGHVETERFISLIIKEHFDYTEWQKNLFEDMTIEELSEKAMQNRLSKRNALEPQAN